MSFELQIETIHVFNALFWLKGKTMIDESEGGILAQTLSIDYGASIARAISEYAYFEFQIDELIWDLADIEPEIGACFTAQIVSLHSRLHTLIAIATLQKVEKSLIDKLNILSGKSHSISDRRNRIVHDPWFHSFESHKHYRLNKTAKSKLDFEYKHVPEEEVETFRLDVGRLTNEFADVKSSILARFWTEPFVRFNRYES